MRGAILFLLSLNAFANIDLGKLQGEWISGCAQSQLNHKQGYTIETYRFTSVEGDFEFERSWFLDMNCQESGADTEMSKGKMKIGKSLLNFGFNPEGTYEANFQNEASTDLGLIWVNSSYSDLRISRGFMNGIRNTMLGLFIFKKN
jgi:hypothetical protein